MKEIKTFKIKEDGVLFHFCKKGMILRGVIEECNLVVKTEDLIELNRDVLSDNEIMAIKVSADITKDMMGYDAWYFGLRYLEEITKKEKTQKFN